MKKHILSIIYGIVLSGFTVYMFSFAFPLIGGALLLGIALFVLRILRNNR